MSLFRSSIDNIKGAPVPEELLKYCGPGLSVVMFYPGDFTPVCTRQLCSYNSSKELLNIPGASFMAVSPDGEASHRDFEAKYGFSFKLISDAGGVLFKAFQMKTLGMNGRGIVFIRDGKVVLAVRERMPLTYMGPEELIETIKGLNA